jgi:hypothetical protein
MTRIEKIKKCIEKGYTYCSLTGKIYGVTGKEIRNSKNGYIRICLYHNKKNYNLYGHHLAYFIIHNKIVDYIDHINGNRSDNSKNNLRSVTHQENHWNRLDIKGCYFDKSRGKWISRISTDVNNVKYIGSYDNEVEAREAYLNAKKVYHIIRDDV